MILTRWGSFIGIYRLPKCIQTPRTRLQSIYFLSGVFFSIWLNSGIRTWPGETRSGRSFPRYATTVRDSSTRCWIGAGSRILRAAPRPASCWCGLSNGKCGFGSRVWKKCTPQHTDPPPVTLQLLAPTHQQSSMKSSNRYKIQNLLASGGYGGCYRAVDRKDRKVYVMKRVPCLSLQTLNLSIEEAVKLSYLRRSKYIVGFRDFFVEQSYKWEMDPTESLNSKTRIPEVISVCIVMEFCPGGDVFTLLRKRRKRDKLFPQSLVVKWLYQSCMALAAIHAAFTIHRDIKTANLFLDANNDILVGDLGVAKDIQAQGAMTCIGTPDYMAPELRRMRPDIFGDMETTMIQAERLDESLDALKTAERKTAQNCEKMLDQHQYDCLVDIYSMGMVLYELLTLKPPVHGLPEPIPNIYDQRLRQLPFRMTDADSKKRPTAQAIVDEICATWHPEEKQEVLQTFNFKYQKAEEPARLSEEIPEIPPSPNHLSDSDREQKLKEEFMERKKSLQALGSDDSDSLLSVSSDSDQTTHHPETYSSSGEEEDYVSMYQLRSAISPETKSSPPAIPRKPPASTASNVAAVSHVPPPKPARPTMPTSRRPAPEKPTRKPAAKTGSAKPSVNRRTSFRLSSPSNVSVNIHRHSLKSGNDSRKVRSRAWGCSSFQETMIPIGNDSTSVTPAQDTQSPAIHPSPRSAGTGMLRYSQPVPAHQNLASQQQPKRMFHSRARPPRKPRSKRSKSPQPQQASYVGSQSMTSSGSPNFAVGSTPPPPQIRKKPPAIHPSNPITPDESKATSPAVRIQSMPQRSDGRPSPPAVPRSQSSIPSPLFLNSRQTHSDEPQRPLSESMASSPVIPPCPTKFKSDKQLLSSVRPLSLPKNDNVSGQSENSRSIHPSPHSKSRHSDLGRQPPPIRPQSNSRVANMSSAVSQSHSPFLQRHSDPGPPPSLHFPPPPLAVEHNDYHLSDQPVHPRHSGMIDIRPSPHAPKNTSR
eukprot:74561_1